MSRVARIVVVTGGLTVTGAVVGALCAYVAVVLIFAPMGESWMLADADILRVSAIVGGFLGATSVPVVFWGLLRFVPLGRAIAWCAVASILGGIGGWLVGSGVDALGGSVIGALGGALAGFVSAALVLRRAVPNAARHTLSARGARGVV